MNNDSWAENAASFLNASILNKGYDTYIPKTTYIVILCLALLVISIILEVIRIKMMRKKLEEITNELIIFFIWLEISLITLIFYVCKFGLTRYYIRGVIDVFSFPYFIEFIPPRVVLIISVIMVLKPLIYIIKNRKKKKNNQKEAKHGK